MPAAISPRATATTSSRNWRAGDVLPAGRRPARGELHRVREPVGVVPHRVGQVAASPMVATAGQRTRAPEVSLARTAGRRGLGRLRLRTNPRTRTDLPGRPGIARRALHEVACHAWPTRRRSRSSSPRHRTAVAAVICDFARYPEWVGGGRSRSRWSRSTRTATPARSGSCWTPGVVADEYTLAYEYAEDISRIEWHLVAPSKMQKEQDGSYDIVDNADGTSTVTYTLAVELAIGMLGMFKRKAEKMIMDTALKELKRRVEPRGRLGGRVSHGDPRERGRAASCGRHRRRSAGRRARPRRRREASTPGFATGSRRVLRVPGLPGHRRAARPRPGVRRAAGHRRRRPAAAGTAACAAVTRPRPEHRHVGAASGRARPDALATGCAGGRRPGRAGRRAVGTQATQPAHPHRPGRRRDRADDRWRRRREGRRRGPPRQQVA